MSSFDETVQTYKIHTENLERNFGGSIECDNEIAEICPTTKYFQRSINPDNIRDSVEDFRKFREKKKNNSMFHFLFSYILN